MPETTDPVAIVVDIVSNVEDEIQKIKGQLKEIGVGDITKELRITNVEEEIATEQAKLSAWAADDIEKNVDIDGFQGMVDDGFLDQMTREHLGRMTRDITGQEMRPPGGMAEFAETEDILPEHVRRGFELDPIPLEGLGGGSVIAEAMDGDGGDDGPGLLRQMADASDDFREKLGKLRPNMMMWWNILAALIPIMVTLVGLVIGLAAAIGALTIAAAGIIGVGLLGWGRNATESLQNLQEQAIELGQTLFKVLQPAARALQPILEGWMQGAPEQVQKLVEPLAGLTVFQDELADAGSGLVEWIAAVVERINTLDEIAGQVAMQFASVFGEFVINALTNMLMDVHRNQRAYMELGAILMNLLITLFNLLKAIGFAIAQFAGLTQAVKMLSSLLSNKWVVALLTVITSVILLETALGALASMITIVRGAQLGAMLMSWIPTLTTVIGKVWALTASLGALRTVLATLGIGLALGAAGLLGMQAIDSMTAPSPTREHRTGTSGGGNTFIEIQGDVREREMDRLLDQVGNETQNEMTMQENMGTK